MSAWSFYNNLPDSHKENVYVGFHDDKTKQYMCINFSKINDAIKYPQLLSRYLSIANNMRRDSTIKETILKKYRNRPIKYYFHLWRLDILSVLRHDKSFLKFNIDSKEWRRIRKSRSDKYKPIAKTDSITARDVLRADDVIFLLDAAWQPNQTEQVKNMASRGIKMLTMVHDLIPIKFTNYTNTLVPHNFFNWIINTKHYTTSYLAVSKSTSTDLQRFLNDFSIVKDIHVVPLVQDFERPEQDDSALRLSGVETNNSNYSNLINFSSVKPSIRVYGNIPFILCVGTIEIRKSPLRLLQAWKQLIERSGGDIPRLVFAGHMGWLVDDFRTVLEATGNLMGYIDVIEQPTDIDLSFLYENCLFIVMPSIYEGWGLPVGEGLSFGKTAVISNTSSLPEVGQDLVEYCDPTSVSSIADAVWKLVSEPEARLLLENKIRNTKLRSWNDVGKDLIEIVKQMEIQGGGAPPENTELDT
jgi:glycosyltransferase involved in cell wall biosynthesis